MPILPEPLPAGASGQRLGSRGEDRFSNMSRSLRTIAMTLGQPMADRIGRTAQDYLAPVMESYAQAEEQAKAPHTLAPRQQQAIRGNNAGSSPQDQAVASFNIAEGRQLMSPMEKAYDDRRGDYIQGQQFSPASARYNEQFVLSPQQAEQLVTPSGTYAAYTPSKNPGQIGSIEAVGRRVPSAVTSAANSLMGQMQAAASAGDWKAFSEISQHLSRMMDIVDKAEDNSRGAYEFSKNNRIAEAAHNLNVTKAEMEQFGVPAGKQAELEAEALRNRIADDRAERRLALDTRTAESEDLLNKANAFGALAVKSEAFPKEDQDMILAQTTPLIGRTIDRMSFNDNINIVAGMSEPQLRAHVAEYQNLLREAARMTSQGKSLPYKFAQRLNELQGYIDAAQTLPTTPATRRGGSWRDSVQAQKEEVVSEARRIKEQQLRDQFAAMRLQ